MTCFSCEKEHPSAKMIVQLTIFYTEEHYCPCCWDKLIEINKEEKKRGTG